MYYYGRHLLALCQQIRLLVDLLPVLRFHGGVLPGGDIPLPETKGKTLEEIEAHFEGKTIA